MEYRNITVRLESEAPEKFRASVVSSAGEGVGLITLESLKPLSDSQKRFLEAASRDPSVGLTQARQAGETLFSSIFSDGILQLFRRSSGVIESNKGLRIVIRLRADEPNSSFLLSLPWELLWDPVQAQFLSLDRSYSIVRQIERPAISVLPISLPIRILVVHASSIDVDEVRSEVSSIAAECAGFETQISILKMSRIEELREVLIDEEINILHVIALVQSSEDGGLVLQLEDRDGTPAWLGHNQFADNLIGISSLRLVVIHASDSGDSSGYSAVASLAANLVTRGILAAIVTQSPITAERFASFSGVLYSRLASGDPVDAAINEGRLSLAVTSRDSFDWTAPALYVGVRDELFPLQERSTRSSFIIPDVRKAAANAIASELGTVPSEAAAIEARLEGGTVKNPQAIENAFDGAQQTTALVLRQIEASYEQARIEARRWSSASLVAAGCGLLMVVATLLSLLLGKIELGTITAIGSLVPTVISGLFFTQLKAANKRLSAMDDELTIARKMHFAQEIAKTMETPRERDKAKAAVLLALIKGRVSGQEEVRPPKEVSNKRLGSGLGGGDN